jgi:hypothetical protein
MTLRTVPSDRDVRTRLTAFRVDFGTRYVTICLVSLVAGSPIVTSELVRLVFALTLEHVTCGVACCRKEWGKRYTMRCMERGLWGGGRETVNRKRKLSAVFLQPIQNSSCMSHVLLLCISFYAYWLYFIYV